VLPLPLLLSAKRLLEAGRIGGRRRAGRYGARCKTTYVTTTILNLGCEGCSIWGNAMDVGWLDGSRIRTD